MSNEGSEQPVEPMIDQDDRSGSITFNTPVCELSIGQLVGVLGRQLFESLKAEHGKPELTPRMMAPEWFTPARQPELRHNLSDDEVERLADRVAAKLQHPDERLGRG